jgi:multiple sugar transport system substrate-binding protein
MIAAGRQIVQSAWVSDFTAIQGFLRSFGGEIVFKGFPAESRNGTSLQLGTGLAMTTSCTSKEGAWSFMRTILTADWQRDSVSWMFPTNMTVFNEKIVEALTPPEENEMDIMYGGGVIIEGGGGVARSMPYMPFEQPPPLTQADIDMVMELINSVTGIIAYDQSLMDIILEGARDFFGGRGSAQDAARVIQNRASTYISEQR